MAPDPQDILQKPVSQFLSDLAAKRPTPGGGSVAGLVAALSSALGRMSLAYSQGKSALAEHEAVHARIQRRLETAGALAEQLIAEDIEAFSLYQQLRDMHDGPEKTQATRTALAAAINVPRELTKLALALLDDLMALVDKTTAWLISDLQAAAALAVATCRLCEYNVETNAAGLDDATAAEELIAAAAADTRRADQRLAAIEHAGRTARANA